VTMLQLQCILLEVSAITFSVSHLGLRILVEDPGRQSNSYLTLFLFKMPDMIKSCQCILQYFRVLTYQQTWTIK
jgi:hypothetical protein